MSTFTFPLYKNTTPDGPAFIAGICDGGKLLAITFSGPEPSAVVESARSFANRNLDTPERRARIAARAEAAKARKAEKSPTVAPNTERRQSTSAGAGDAP